MAPLEYRALVDLLGFASANRLPVRLVTADAREVVGVPTAVDLGIDATEVLLHPEGDDQTEIVVAIPQIARAEFV